MKKIYIYITVFISAIVILTISVGRSGEFGAVAGATGAPGDFYGSLACGTGGCHSTNPISGDPSLAITMLDAATNRVVTSYHVSRKYIVRVELTRASLKAAGFQSTVEKTGNIHVGTIATKLRCQYSDAAHTYVTHTTSKVSAPGKWSWEYYWTSPATNQGDITIYAAGNCANNNNQNTGDTIFLMNKTFPYLDATAVNNMSELLQHVRIYPNPVVSNVTIELDLKSPEKTEVSLFNSKGECVKNIQVANINPGQQTIESDLTTFPAGIYYFKVTSGTESSIQKILKL